MTAPTDEPIWIRCEGSLQSAARLDDELPASSGMCQMCGQWVALIIASSTVVMHYRDDILARLKRGDFA